MKKTLFAFVAAAAVCYTVAGQAQSMMQQPQESSVPQASLKMTLDDRFSRCLNDASCSIQTRMALMQEENDEMNLRFQKIHQACADTNFKSCVDLQSEDVKKWQMTQNQMQQMMQAMGAASLEKKEPAAGGSEDAKEKSIWDKIWQYGDQE